MMDDLGNWNFVTTYVIIQDNMGACSLPEESIAMVSGTIADWKGNPVQRVGINSRQQAEIEVGRMTTTEDGTYSFNLQMDQDYLLTPTKNINPLNGVSTFDLVLISKHILGISPLENPYQWIAADINQSGSVTTFDIVPVSYTHLTLPTIYSV